MHREGMHPADQFEAWRKMAEEGLSVEEIAKRHGATKCLIEKRLKLGRLSPVILEALRNDKLDIERAQAFTVSEDHARQEAVFKSLSQGGHYLNSRSIKAALTEGEVPSTDKLAVFVGRRAYRAAGGEIRSDLFGKVVYFKDRDLLIKLAGDALARAAEKLRAKGWLWIEASFDNDAPHPSGLRRVEPKRIAFSKEDKAEKTGLETRLRELEEADDGNVEAYDEWKEIEERLRELEGKRRAFRPTDMAKAGGYLFIGRDGELESALGYVRPGDDPRAEAAAAKKKAAEKAEAQPKGFSKSLRDDLAALRLEMLRAELITHPDIACDLMAFHLIRSVMGAGYTASPLSLSAHRSSGVGTRSGAGDMGAFAHREAVEEAIASLPMDWLHMENELESFEAFRALDDDAKRRLQAYATALMLNPQLSDEELPDATFEQVARLVNFQPASYWTPGPGFFQRITKGQMLEIAGEVIGQDYAARVASGKKGELADSMGAAFLPPEDGNDAYPTARASLEAWVPACLTVKPAGEVSDRTSSPSEA